MKVSIDRLVHSNPAVPEAKRTPTGSIGPIQPESGAFSKRKYQSKIP